MLEAKVYSLDVGAPVGFDVVGHSTELQAVGQGLVVGQCLGRGSPVDIYGREHSRLGPHQDPTRTPHWQARGGQLDA